MQQFTSPLLQAYAVYNTNMQCIFCASFLIIFLEYANSSWLSVFYIYMFYSLAINDHSYRLKELS